jgi:hypothetical protein
MRSWEQGIHFEIDEETLLYRHDLRDIANYRLAMAIGDSKFLLKSLSLCDIYDPTLSGWNLGDDFQSFLDSFFSTLRNMTSLESRSLSFSKDPSEGHHEQLLSDIVKALTPLPLSAIKLRHISGSVQDFVGLLTQHKSTLRRISFKDTGIVDGYP